VRGLLKDQAVAVFYVLTTRTPSSSSHTTSMDSTGGQHDHSLPPPTEVAAEGFRSAAGAVLTWFLCGVGTIAEMSTPVRGRAAAKSLPALSELDVARVTAAVHGTLVCFVLIVVALHALGFQLGTAADLELVGVLLLGAAGQVVWSGRAGGRG